MEVGDRERRGRLVLGAILLAVGLLALAGRAVGADAFAIGWPLLVIVPGLLLFAAAVATGGRAGSAFAVPAGVVTVTGIVLAVQNATGLWSTWAYAWALVAPGGIGIGLLVYGLLSGQRDLIRSGVPVLLTGVALFLGFGVFFEGVLGLNGAAIAGSETILAAGLVVLGALLIVGSQLGRRPR